MKLVLQCAMCGTQHPVGAVVCSTCRATGVTQLRLLFECQTCGRLDLSPACGTCPRPAGGLVYELDDDLIIAEEIADDPVAPDPGARDAAEDFFLELNFEVVDELDAELVVAPSGDSSDDPGSEFHLDLDEDALAELEESGTFDEDPDDAFEGDEDEGGEY